MSALHSPTGWAALLTPYAWHELAERYQAIREAEARRRALAGAAGAPAAT